MKRWILLTIVALATIPAPHLEQTANAQETAPVTAQVTAPVTATGGQAAPSADEAARRVQAFYAQTKDYQAKFTQTYHDLAAGDQKVNTGKVYFKKPGKMRWDYVKQGGGQDKIYVSDGSSFWVYEYDFKQVFKQCLKDSQLPTSLSFLMGTGDLLKEFDVEYTDKSTATAPQLRLTPKSPTPSYKELRFTLDPQTYQVVRTAIYDPYGNMNEIVFSTVVVNKNLPDSGFDFKVPKGARVLNPQENCS